MSQPETARVEEKEYCHASRGDGECFWKKCPQLRDGEAEQLAAESARLTAAIDALDAHRRRMAEHLPIPGLSIAVQVSTLRAKGQRLPVVFVDGAEALDSEHFEALVRELAAQGTQAFVARVTDEPLSVRTDEVPNAAA